MDVGGQVARKLADEKGKEALDYKMKYNVAHQSNGSLSAWCVLFVCVRAEVRTWCFQGEKAKTDTAIVRRPLRSLPLSFSFPFPPTFHPALLFLFLSATISLACTQRSISQLSCAAVPASVRSPHHTHMALLLLYM
eukprot:2357438-Rhodomonas_salina.3